MNAQAAKQLTMRLDRALTSMAARAHEERPLAYFATVFHVSREDLQAWVDQFNKGSKVLDAERLLEVKRELGLIVELRRASSPANNPPRGFLQPGPIVPGGRNLYEAPEAFAARSAGAPAPIPQGPHENGRHWLERQGIKILAVIECYQVVVTPPLAKAWLALNTGNRKPSRAKVRRFAAIIAENKWIRNGETTKFAESGRLIDGQSRLQAIVESGKFAVLELRFNLPDAAQQTMDCGEVRRGTHTLEMLGEKDPLVLSPALRLIFKWETGILGSNGGKIAGKMTVLENQAMRPLLERHAGIRASVSWAIELGARIRKFMPHSEAAFFHYVLGRANAQKRDQFFAGLLQKNDMTQPVALLSQRILNAQTGRMTAGARIRLFVKAWNAHFNRVNIRELVLTPREGVAPIAGIKEAA